MVSTKMFISADAHASGSYFDIPKNMHVESSGVPIPERKPISFAGPSSPSRPSLAVVHTTFPNPAPPSVPTPRARLVVSPSAELGRLSGHKALTKGNSATSRLNLVDFNVLPRALDISVAPMTRQQFLFNSFAHGTSDVMPLSAPATTNNPYTNNPHSVPIDPTLSRQQYLEIRYQANIQPKPSPETYRTEFTNRAADLEMYTGSEIVDRLFAEYTQKIIPNPPADVHARRLEERERMAAPFEIEKGNLVIDRQARKKESDMRILLSDLEVIAANPVGRTLLELIQQARHPVTVSPGDHRESSTALHDPGDPRQSNGIGLPVLVKSADPEDTLTYAAGNDGNRVILTRTSTLVHELAHAYLTTEGRQPLSKLEAEKAAILIENAFRFWSKPQRELRSLDYEDPPGFSAVSSDFRAIPQQ